MSLSAAEIEDNCFEFFEEEALGDGEGDGFDGIDALLNCGLEFLVVG